MVNVMLLLGVIFGFIIILGIGGGGFYWLWVRSRTKKITYDARIYEVSGELTPLRDPEGLIIQQLDLKVLKPYATDIIERVELGHKITTYRLIKLNRPVPEVTAECITFWGKNKREINVLKDGDNFTLMRMGCDKNRNLVFEPLPYDLSNMLLNQYSLKEERYQKEKNALQAITPWIIAGVVMMGLVMLGYVLGESWIKVSENNAQSVLLQTESGKEMTDVLLEVAKVIKSDQCITDTINNLGLQKDTS